MTITLNGTTGITTPDISTTAQSTDITTTGDISAVDLTASGGVYLGGTAAANYLDDYEEGTWTPVVTDGTTSVSGVGTYTKIGNIVCIRASVGDVESGGALSGTVYMTGLPFTSVTRDAISSFINYQNGTSSWSAMTNTSNTQIRFYQMSVNGADDVQITGADTNTYTDFYVCGTYRV